MRITTGHTGVGGELIEIVLTVPCDSGIKNHRFCGRCNGVGEKLTEAGQAIIDLVRDHGDFAREDHSD